MKSHTHALTAALALALASAAPLAQAQATNWPEKPVRIVMPFPTGGASDVLISCA